MTFRVHYIKDAKRGTLDITASTPDEARNIFASRCLSAVIKKVKKVRS